MRTGPKLGLVAGLGVGAAIHYYREIAAAMAARGMTLNLCMAHAESSIVTGLALAGEKQKLVEYLAPIVDSLERAGATFATLPALTPHFAFEPLNARVSIPMLDARQSIRAEIAARKLKRIAAFGTRPTIESRVFGAVATDEAVVMEERDIAYVHEAYYAIVKTGACTPEHRTGLAALGRRLVREMGADAIALAGTDLSLAFVPGELDFPVIDCAALHIAEIVRILSGEAQEPRK